jgi:hypothetical protein
VRRVDARVRRDQWRHSRVGTPPLAARWPPPPPYRYFWARATCGPFAPRLHASGWIPAMVNSQ